MGGRIEKACRRWQGSDAFGTGRCGPTVVSILCQESSGNVGWLRRWSIPTSGWPYHHFHNKSFPLHPFSPPELHTCFATVFLLYYCTPYLFLFLYIPTQHYMHAMDIIVAVVNLIRVNSKPISVSPGTPKRDNRCILYFPARILRTFSTKF